MPQADWDSLSAGDGQDLVVFHGLFGDKLNWKTLLSKLDGWRIHLLDMPGHGETPSPASWHSARLAEDFWDTSFNQGWKRPVLLGHSWGGKIAWEATLQRPDEVSALILGDMGPGPTPLDVSGVGNILLEAGSLDRDEAKALLFRSFAAPVAGFFLKSWRGGSRPWTFDLENILTHHQAIREGLTLGRRYPGPTLQLWGEHSSYSTDEARELSSLFLCRRIERIVPGAGHWFHQDNPSATLGFLTEFLASLRVTKPPRENPGPSPCGATQAN